MPRKRKSTEEKREFKPCGHRGCSEEGLYQAPKNRAMSDDQPRKPSDYHWFCLEHIREYNSKWDFFAGMSEKEVQEFQKESVTGHRRTNKWDLDGSPASVWQWNESIRKFAEHFADGEDFHTVRKPKLPKNIQDAADLLEITMPAAIAEIKKKYKLLVKQYHPDVNKGCKISEEKFKAINEAYHVLLDSDFVKS